MSARTGSQTFSPSPEQLQEVAARHGLGAVDRWRPLAGGWANPVLLLECERGPAVLKINIRYLDTANVATEVAALALAAGTLAASGVPFRAPRVVGADTSRTLLPFEYLLTEHLPGTNGGDACKRADDAARLDLSRQLGETTRRLHAVGAVGAVGAPGERYGGWDPERNALGTDDDWQHLIARRGESLLTQASVTGLITPDTLAAIARWLDRHLDAVPHRPARVLVHHDLTPWNTLVEQRAQNGQDSHDSRWRITGVFDFEWSIVGPTAAELATQMSGPGGLVDPTAFLDAYTHGTRLGDEFLRHTLYYQMLYHLRTVVEFARHWRQWGAWWIQRRVEVAEGMLRGEPPWAFAAAGYRWPF